MPRRRRKGVKCPNGCWPGPLTRIWTTDGSWLETYCRKCKRRMDALELMKHKYLRAVVAPEKE